MKEGLNIEGAKTAWKLMLERKMADVEKELKRREDGPKVPYVAETCPEKYKDLAERIVALQVKLGEFSREDLSKADVERIKDMKRRDTKLSFKDNIALMVANDGYVNNDTIFARHVIQVLDEFDAIYNRYYQEYGAIPLNVFSTEVRLFFKNHKNGLSKEDMLRGVLEVYRPELANVKIEHHNYEALPRSRQVIAEDEMKRIIAELESIAVDGYIDDIFSPKYETYFKELCARLKLAGYTFDDFVHRNTSLTYTYCFAAEIMPAVTQMAYSYYEKHGTTVGITDKDPYLRNKIDVVQEVSGIYTIGGLMDYLGIDSDNYDNDKSTISETDLKFRESILLKKLEELCPSRVIMPAFATKNERVYDEIAFLSRRFGFSNINDYLKARGFIRDVAYDRKAPNCFYLSERDIEFYGFLDGCEHVECAEAYLESKGVRKVDPYANLGVYRKLAYEKRDYLSQMARKHKQIPTKQPGDTEN